MITSYFHTQVSEKNFHDITINDTNILRNLIKTNTYSYFTCRIIHFKLISKLKTHQSSLNRQHTLQIGLNSFSCCGFSHFKTKVIKEAFARFGHLHPFSNFFTTPIISPFNSSQKNLIKPKLNVSGHWLLLLSFFYQQ